LSSQLSDLVEATKDPLVLVYVWNYLGKNVPPDACFTDTILHVRRKVLKRLLTGPGHLPHRPMNANMFWVQQRQTWAVEMARLERKQREMIEDHLTTALLDVQERDLTTQLFRESSLERFIAKLAEAGPDVLRKHLASDDPVARLLVILTIARRHLHMEKELIERLNDPHPAVRQAIHGTLVRLARGTDFGPARNITQPGITRCADRWRQWQALQESETIVSIGNSKPAPMPTTARPAPLDIDKIIAIPSSTEERTSPSAPRKE
jgi:hypothetical protein